MKTKLHSMSRQRVLTTQKQVQHLKNEVGRITGELHFCGLKLEAETLWSANQPLEATLEKLQQVIANFDLGRVKQ